MEMTEITNSSNIKAAGYDADTRTMRNTFASGKTYEYEDFPEAEWEKYAATFNVDGASPGKYFAENIRSQFTGTPVEAEAAGA